MIKYLIAFPILLVSCAPKPVNELDAMTKDVIKNKTGVDIQIRPLEEKQCSK